MTVTANARAAIANSKPARLSLLQRLVAWNAAWRESQHIRRLDADALRDAGLTERQRDGITVRQIVSRTRA